MNLTISNKAIWILEAFNYSSLRGPLATCMYSVIIWRPDSRSEMLALAPKGSSIIGSNDCHDMNSLRALLSSTHFEALLKVIVAPSTSRGPTCLCDFEKPLKVGASGLYRSFAKVFILSESLPSLHPYIHHKTIFSTQSVTHSKATFFNHHQTLVRRYRD